MTPKYSPEKEGPSRILICISCISVGGKETRIETNGENGHAGQEEKREEKMEQKWRLTENGKETYEAL